MLRKLRPQLEQVVAQEAALQSLATKLQQAEWEARAYADKEAPLQMQAQQARAIPAPTPPPATPAPAPSPPPHRRHQRQASPPGKSLAAPSARSAV